MKVNHARHNEKVCKHLKDNGSFNDWVVTTAFYSSIHYIDCELFPKQYISPANGKHRTFNDFESYYHSTDKTRNKHKVRQDLVEEFIPELADDYQTLKDNCWTARYVDYKIDNEIAELCYTCLQNIKGICEPT